MELIKNDEYMVELNHIKEVISENRYSAMVVVNSTMILTYYQIGCIINSKKNWGEGFIQKLANDLKEYGSGYSFDHLRKMARFASIFSKNDIWEQPVPKIPWGTIIIIMNKSSSKEEILWYVNQTYKNRWSRSQVLKQFELQAYQRNIIEPITTDNTMVQEISKDTLALSFINEKDVSNEKDLKEKILDNIILFLQELGPGFALVGKEYKLITPTNKFFYIDLLFYHTKIHAYVVIEVKIDDVSPADLGQLNFYINAINDLEKIDGDNETVGLLLCKNADKYVVKTSLTGMTNPIGITKYKLFEELPEYLSKKLNEMK